MARRKHSKVSKLPQEVRDTVHSLLLDGKTYEQIIEHLDELVAQGVIKKDQVPSDSSLSRYTPGFLAKLERSKIAKDQAREIVRNAEGEGLILEEAAVNLVLNEIMGILIPEDPDKALNPKALASIAISLAKLQSSSSVRERAKISLKREVDKKIKAAAKEVGKLAKSKGLSKDTVDQINKQILGIKA
ncbi:phage protein Gp27 family protein [Nitrospina gracilis]|uniref:phage protein Gp27 family protein n=1 Tax=Nitrospina gracilis TaxID=35801 RepID=UPI001F358B8D|nr:phage protein Gp27 family protein [Nitrospina gracilis]MCF8719224.1 transcription initiation factor TFIIIB Brf1 subunit/transcription initiation factor TFIIB [Nitrospina gracilis Nb-211]